MAQEINIYGTLRSKTTEETVALAEEVLNTETGNKVNVDLRKVRDKIDSSLLWH